MAKASDDGSNGSYTVFLDSNLDTHLVLIVSVQHTVRDLKDKIMIEHPHCFPNIGEIIVNALKIKRKGCFYHLSDPMLVKSVFNGSMKTLFLQFDASRQVERKENPYHLEPGASDLPSHVFTRDGLLSETNTLLLDRPSKDVSILDVPPVPEVGSSQPRDIFPQSSSDDKEKLENANLERLSIRLLKDDHLFPQNSSDDKKKPKNADLEGLSARLPEDDPFLSPGNKKKNKKKKKPSSSYDQVDYEVPSGKNVWEEASKVALGNSHGDLRGEIDAALAPKQTNAAHPFVGFDMGKTGTSKVDGRDTSDHIEATRRKESKRSKKHQGASVEGLDLPEVAECGNLIKDGTTLVHETVCCDNNNVDDVRGETSEVALENIHRNLGEEFDAALAPEKNDAADPFVDVDMRKPGTSNMERMDTSDSMEASRGRKLKRSEKHQAARVEGLDLPRFAELGNLTKDNTTLSASKNVCCDNNVGDDVREKTSEASIMCKPGPGNTERADTSDHVEASRGRKLKRSKKHQVASVEGVDLPRVAELGNLKKDNTPLVSEKVFCDNNDDVREKTSKVALENNHINLGGEFDAASAPEKTDAAGPFVDVKCKPGTSNMERRGTSDHVESSEGRKSKRSKKHRAASVEGLNNLPTVVEPGNLKKDGTTLAHENFCCDINDGDDGRAGIIEKEEKALLQDDVPKQTPSEAPTSKLKSMCLGKTETDSKGVVISSKLLQSSVILGTGDPGDKRRKKSKKSKEKTSEVALENNHVNLGGEFDTALASEKTGAAGPFVDVKCKPGTGNMERRDASDHVDASEGRKSKRSKRHRTASVEGLNNLPVVVEPGNLRKDSTTLAHEKFCCDINDGDDGKAGIIEKEEKALLQDEVPKQMPSEAPTSKLKSMCLGKAETDSKDVVISSKLLQSSVTSGTGDPGDKRRKKSKKSKEKTSEVALENNHVNLGGEFDTALASEKTGAAGPFVDVKCKPGSSNMERRDASDHVDASEGRKSKRSKKQRAASVEGLNNLPAVVEPGNLKKDSTTLAHENFCCDINDRDDGKAGIIEKEEKALLQDEGPKQTPSEAPTSKLKSLCLGKTEMDSKDVVISSKLLQSSVISGTRDPGDKRRKKSKKSRDSDQPSSVAIEDADGVGGATLLNPELNKASFSDHPSEKHATLFRNEKARVSKVGSVNTPLIDLGKEPDACQNEVNFVPPIQITKSQEAEEGSDCKLKKMARKTENSSKNLPDPMAEKRDVSTVDPVLPSDEKKGKSIGSKNAKKTRLGKKGPTKQLTDSMSEAEKDIGSRINCSMPCSIPGTNEPSEAPSDIFVCNIDRPRHEADIRDDILASGCTDKGNDHMEVPKFESDKISCIKNFEPSQRKHEVAPVKDLGAKSVQIERSDKELPSNKTTNKHNVHSLGTSPGLQESFNSNDNQGFKEKPRDDSSDPVKFQSPISKAKKGEPMPKTPNRKTKTTAGDRVKYPTSRYHEKCDSTPHEASRTKILDSSGTSSPVHSSIIRVPFRAGDNTFEKENSVDWDASGSSWEISDVGVLKNIKGRELKSQSKYNPVTAGKTSSKKTGEVFNNSIRERSLFATSGTIFNDSCSESSEDDGGINNSETSTKTPSDSSSSLSSDYLEGTSHSPHNAVYSRKRNENGGDNLMDSQSGGPKNMTLDMILRSSSSYKKAKLTASQSQLNDNESQPVEFVLDGLADP
ncbi:uncharacterized protein LOC122075483 [Macadamia integrifolia]|uniref:uncharacterized protein LOC122075483 n=1 Tax=Macadamia integrifolia TaxID=60698 RepID=UPI001C4E3A78|nr:uncharacterized protein LOC122075483 [Macadamia integrifolia]